MAETGVTLKPTEAEILGSNTELCRLTTAVMACILKYRGYTEDKLRESGNFEVRLVEENFANTIYSLVSATVKDLTTMRSTGDPMQESGVFEDGVYIFLVMKTSSNTSIFYRVGDFKTPYSSNISISADSGKISARRSFRVPPDAEMQIGSRFFVLDKSGAEIEPYHIEDIVAGVSSGNIFQVRSFPSINQISVITYEDIKK